MYENLIIDNEFKNLLPQLSQEEFDTLENDIIANGVREPLILWQGILIDGHNRYAICQKHNISFTIKSVELPDRNAALIWIAKNQIARRNLSKFDKIRLALRYKDHFSAYAKANQRQSPGRGKKGKVESPDLLPTNTRTEIAKLAGASETMVSQVEFIEKNGLPEIKEQLGTGNIKLSEAYRQTRQSQKAEKHRIKDDRLESRREQIRVNREEIKNLKIRLKRLSDSAIEVKNQINALQDENRKLQNEIQETKGKLVD